MTDVLQFMRKCKRKESESEEKSCNSFMLISRLLLTTRRLIQSGEVIVKIDRFVCLFFNVGTFVNDGNGSGSNNLEENSVFLKVFELHSYLESIILFSRVSFKI